MRKNFVCEAQQGAQEFRAVLFGADLYGTDLNGAQERHLIMRVGN